MFWQFFPEDFKRDLMASFRGNLPLEFLSFCLENQFSEETTTPDASQKDHHERVSNEAPTVHFQAEFQNSPFSVDSFVDVPAYAEEKVLQMEKARTSAEQKTTVPKGNNSGETGQVKTGYMRLPSLSESELKPQLLPIPSLRTLLVSSIWSQHSESLVRLRPNSRSSSLLLTHQGGVHCIFPPD